MGTELAKWHHTVGSPSIPLFSGPASPTTLHYLAGKAEVLGASRVSVGGFLRCTGTPARCPHPQGTINVVLMSKGEIEDLLLLKATKDRGRAPPLARAQSAKGARDGPQYAAGHLGRPARGQSAGPHRQQQQQQPWVRPLSSRVSEGAPTALYLKSMLCRQPWFPAHLIASVPFACASKICWRSWYQSRGSTTSSLQIQGSPCLPAKACCPQRK
eukprot:1150497-Pelagomonas_calceolata.AAC.5